VTLKSNKVRVQIHVHAKFHQILAAATLRLRFEPVVTYGALQMLLLITHSL